MSTVGTRLRKLRKEKGLTQTEVTGGQYSKEYVSQVELGKTNPSRKAVRLFAKYLDVDESYFETGIDLAGRERFENLMANGEVLLERREYGEAGRVFEEARTIGEKAENIDFVWRAEVGRAWALHHAGKHREAIQLLASARVYYEERKPGSLELAVVLYRLGCARDALGDLKLALLLLEESLKILDRGPLPADHLRIRIYRRMASIHSRRRDLEAGREAAEWALDLARDLDDRRAVAEAYWEAATLEERQRDFTRATEYALRARDILVDLGDQLETAKLLSNLGDIKNQQGRPEEGLQYFEDGLEALKSLDDPVTRSCLLNGLASARLAMGEAGPSLEAANKSLAIMEGRENHVVVVGTSHLIRARAFLAQGRLPESRGELEAAKGVFEAMDLPLHLSESLLVEGDLLLAEGRLAEAAQVFRRSSELLQGVLL
jgi:tetratricopeptide (TPR) repeat protein